MRRMWNIRINAGAQEHGHSYNQVIHALKVSNIQINRKVLSTLAFYEPLAFRAIVTQACDIAQVPKRQRDNYGLIASTIERQEISIPRQKPKYPNPHAPEHPTKEYSNPLGSDVVNSPSNT
jgi:Ribosomal protein L20